MLLLKSQAAISPWVASGVLYHTRARAFHTSGLLLQLRTPILLVCIKNILHISTRSYSSLRCKGSWFGICHWLGKLKTLIIRHSGSKNFAKVHPYKTPYVKMKSLNLSRLFPTALSMNVLRLMPGKWVCKLKQEYLSSASALPLWYVPVEVTFLELSEDTFFSPLIFFLIKIFGYEHCKFPEHMIF